MFEIPRPVPILTIPLKLLVRTLKNTGKKIQQSNSLLKHVAYLHVNHLFAERDRDGNKREDLSYRPVGPKIRIQAKSPP